MQNQGHQHVPVRQQYPEHISPSQILRSHDRIGLNYQPISRSHLNTFKTPLQFQHPQSSRSVQHDHPLQQDGIDEAAFEQAFANITSNLKSTDKPSETQFTSSDIAIINSDAHSEFRACQAIYYVSNVFIVTILRLGLVQSIMSFSQEALHRGSIYLTLLERNDYSTVNNVQKYLLMSLLDDYEKIFDPHNEYRYNFPERMQNLRLKLVENLSEEPDQILKRLEPIRLFYRHILQGANRFLTLINQNKVHTVARESEINADVLMQVNSLPGNDVASKTMHLFNPDTFKNISQALRTDSDIDIIKSELDLLSPGHVSSSSCPYQDLWNRISTLHSQTHTHQTMNHSFPLASQSSEISPLTDTTETKQTNDLAQTADELLQKTSSNKSDKFSQSTFLSLMRELRDGKKEVRGRDIVDVDSLSQPPSELEPQSMVDNSSYRNDTQRLVSDENDENKYFHNENDGMAVREILQS